MNEAMAAVTNLENEEFRGVLPRSSTALPKATLVALLLLSRTLDLDGDVFGKIYEYFLGEFASPAAVSASRSLPLISVKGVATRGWS